MELQLMQLRKKAGYRSRSAFADVLGISERKLKAWEVRETRITFEDACMIADALECSLDELAGRDEYVGTFSDGRQMALNSVYSALSDEGKDAALGSVRGIKAAEGARAETEGAQAAGSA